MDALDLITYSVQPTSKNEADASDAMDGLNLLKQSVMPSTSGGDDRVGNFVQQYQPVAERIGKKLGVAPEALLGQWGLETGWGQSVIPGTNNLGNIKDFSGRGTTAKDNMTGSVDAYRTYASTDEFADDFASLLGRRYKSAIGTGQDAQRFFAALKANGYAEDPDYVAKGTRAAQMAAQALGSSHRDTLPLIPLTDKDASKDAKKVERTTAEAAKDLGIGLAAGVTGGVSALASVAGADNAVARTTDEWTKDLLEGQSEQRKAERAQRQQKIQEAESSGSTWEELKAYAGSFTDAPVETLLGAVGSSAPTLLAAFIPGGQAGALAWIARGAQMAVGAAQGAGAVKSSIYEAVENRLIQEGYDADTAAKVAAGAQAYDGANAGQIAAGTILGAAAGVLGAEAALSKVVNKAPGAMGSRAGNAAVSALAEMPTEALQGGQERYAANTALVNQGFTDVNPMTGVAGSAALEGIAGAGVGGAMGAAQRVQAPLPVPKPGDALREAAEQKDSPMAKAMVAAGADQQLDAQAQADADAQAQAAALQDPAPEQPADPDAEYAQQLNERAQQLRELLQDRSVMDQLREAAGMRMTDVMGEIATATSSRAKPEVREQAMTRIEMALSWAGIGPDAKPATAPAEDTAALPYDNVLEVDSQGNVMGVNERQAQREARANAEPFTDVTPVAPAPEFAATPTQSPALPAPDTAVAVGPDGTATTMEQRQAQANAPREPFRDVTPVPGAKEVMTPVARTGREATAIRQRREDLMQHARNGMTTVERRGDRFAMVNPATKQEYLLGSTADAVLARKAVADVINAQAAIANTNPSDKQKQTGNYKKGRVTFEGLKIAIENPIGSTRSGTDPNGERWETPMELAHYGDLEGTKGADGDAIDVYLADSPRSNQPAYVIDQYNLDGSFDEHKVVMGAFSQGEAVRIYDAGFTDGTGPQRRGAVTAMTPAELKAWAKSPKTKQPAGAIKPKPAPAKSDLEQKADALGAKLIGTRRVSGQTIGLLDRLPDTAAPARKGMTGVNFAAQQALEHLASAFGKKVQFFVGQDMDGFMLPADPSTVFLNAQTEVDVRAVFGHELLHILKVDHPQVHEALTRAVFDRVPDVRAALFKYTQLSYTPEQAVEELVSDVGGDFMREQAFWDDVIEQLYAQHPKAAARKFLKKFLDALTGLWDKITSSKSYASDGFGQALMDEPSQVRDAFVQAIANYAKDSGLASALAVNTKAAPTTSTGNLQNRDRSRAASVAQMQSIATNPDYGRLGISRTPDSGAPMVFAVGDQVPASAATGKSDMAVMSDGQRVPFTYAVMEAADLQPSNLADGSTNPAFASAEPGTVKALNNGRTAGIKSAYETGKAADYRKELLADAASHGVNAAAIEAMQAPVLVRLYAEKDNTEGMAERSQAQGMGLSAAEQAVQDSKLIDTSVLAVYQPGDVTTSGNLDFARAFVGKLQAAGQDVSGMMQANGALSSDGATRLRAALVQAAYGDNDLVADLFDNTGTDIQAIGNALRDVAGEWANMRDNANAGSINPEADATEHLLTALRMVQKQRRDGVALADQAGQVDIETGAVHPLAIGMLRVLYDGENFTKARSRETVTDMLRTYVAAANQTRPDGGLLGDVLGAQEIIESLTQGTLANAITPTATPPATPGGRTDGGNAVSTAQAGAEQGNAADRAAAGSLLDGQRGQPADAAQGQPADTGEILATYTPEEIAARQQAQTQAQDEQAAADAQAQRDEQARKDAADIAARQDASADNFQLGQDPMDALAGQGSIFDEPAQDVIEPMALNIATGNLSAPEKEANNAEDTSATSKFVADAKQHAKRELAKARSKARDARASGNEEMAQRYEGAAEAYASVNWEDFAQAVEANPEVFTESNIDPVLVYSNLPTSMTAGAQQLSQSDQLIGQLEQAAQDLRKQAADWAGRQYKQSSKGIALKGDGPAKGETISVNRVNEKRRDENVVRFEAMADHAEAVITKLRAQGDAYLANLASQWGGNRSAMEQMLAEQSGINQLQGKGAITSTPVTKLMADAIAAYQVAPPNAAPSQSDAGDDYLNALFGGDATQSKRRTDPEQGVRLRAIHNLSADNLRFADEMGGIAVPSIGVVTAEKGGVDGFGEITLVGTKDLADPKREPVFTSDAYTVRFPKAVWDAVPYGKVQALHQRAKAVDAEISGTLAHYVWDHATQHPDANELASRMLYSNSAKIMFLRDQGVNFKPKTKKQAVPFELTLAQFKKVLPVLEAARKERFDSGPRKDGQAYQAAAQLVLTPYLDKLRAQLKGENPQLVNELIEAETKSFERNIGDAITKWERTKFEPVVDAVALNDQLDKAMKNRAPEFAAWVQQQVFPMFAEPRLELGRRKVPYTLDNIVEVMTRSREARGQEKTMTYGEGQVRAATSTNLRNIEQMRELATQSIANPADYEAAKERTGKLMDAYRNAVTEYTTMTNWRGDKDYWQANDDAMKALVKWARGPRTTASLAQALRASSFKGVPEDVLQKGVDAANALLSAPVPYFEAKPQRAVAINEFAGAVIPKKANQQTRDILAKAGIPMVEYDSNKPEARRAALDKITKRLAKDREDVLFSRRRLAEQPLPDAEITTDLADAVANAPARLGAMAPTGWASWLRTQARAGRLDGAKLQQLEIADTLASHPKASMTAQDVAAMVRDAEHELQQLQALIDDHAGTMAQNLRKQGVFAQLCD